jgi:hypothetical protein
MSARHKIQAEDAIDPADYINGRNTSCSGRQYCNVDAHE